MFAIGEERCRKQGKHVLAFNGWTQSGAMSIRGQIWNRMPNFRGLKCAHERESIRLQSAYVLICFFFFFRHQLQWRYLHNKWMPIFGSTKIDWCDFGTLSTSRIEEDEASGQSMWAVRWEQFTFIAIGHPSFGVAVVAHSTAFYMFSASKIIENKIEDASGVSFVLFGRASLTPKPLAFYLWTKNGNTFHAADIDESGERTGK